MTAWQAGHEPCGATRLAVAIVAGLLLGSPGAARAWGLVTHRTVTELAIETLPPGLREAFAARRQRLSDLSVEPDTVRKARYGARESVRHYIDLDLYGAPPFAELPREHAAAVRRFGRKTVDKRGTLPWTLLDLHRRLVAEMRRGDWVRAVGTAGLASHYVADAFMPLHTTADYDGVRSGSPGIHVTIEHKLVDARIDAFRSAVRRRLRAAPGGRYDGARVFAILLASYRAIPPLLAADHQARSVAAFRSHRYLDVLDDRLRGLLVGRLADAAMEIGCFWRTAWDEAGRPPPS